MKSFCPLLPLARVVSVGALLAAVTSLLGACDGGQSGAEVATGNGGGDPPGGDDPPLGGGGDPVPVVCKTDDECRESTLALLESYAAPHAQTPELSSSACEPYGLFYADRQVSGPGCTCDFASSGGIRTVGPTGSGCSFLGRGGQCLWSDAEFAGCSVNDPHACEATCAELARRLTADAERSLQVDLQYARCDQDAAEVITEDGCQSVAKIGDLCFPNYPYVMGKGYDCALGAEAILKASPAQRPEPKTLPALQAYYQPGTDATVQLLVSQEHWGKARGASGFAVKADFFDGSGKDARYGELFDDVAVHDTCRVLSESPLDTSANVRLLTVDRAVLRDGDQEFPLQQSLSSDTDPSYRVDLALAGAQPHSGLYGFSASGGTFGGSIELDRVIMPAALSSPELEAISHIDHGPLALTWTSGTPNTIQLFLDITPQLDNPSGAYHIDCLMNDDGDFTIPESVMAAAPNGLVTATLRRILRSGYGRTGGKDVQVLAESVATHRFVLGPTCDGSALMSACQRSASTIRARYQECSDLEPPPIEQLCPDYLATTCGSCPEYFDCLAASTTCGSDGLSTRAGCGCSE